MTPIETEILMLEQAQRNSAVYCATLKRRADAAKAEYDDAELRLVETHNKLELLRQRFLMRTV